MQSLKSSIVGLSLALEIVFAYKTRTYTASSVTVNMKRNAKCTVCVASPYTEMDYIKLEAPSAVAT